MATTYNKVLYAGTSSAYAALTSYDDSILYFLTDTCQIYKGSDLYTAGLRISSAHPETPSTNVIYHITDTDTYEYYDGSDWITILPDFVDSISSSSDGEVPTAAAVYSFVTEQLSNLASSESSVASVTAGSSDATLTVTSGSGSTSTVTVPGVVTTPSYDSTTRTITLPVSTGTTLEINLGADLVVSSGYYDESTTSIVLVLNDDDGTTITIPVSSLIDVYTGTSTTTATTSVSSSNVISVSVTLSSDTNNAITIDETNGGLLVDLSSYATTSYVDTAVSSVSTDISDLEAAVEELESTVNTLNGTEDVEGSVAYQIAAAVDELDDAISSALSWGTF